MRKIKGSLANPAALAVIFFATPRGSELHINNQARATLPEANYEANCS